MGASRWIGSSALALAIAGHPVRSAASETATYVYDALGRLVQVTRSGGPSAVSSGYEYDQAGNRTRVVTSGAIATPAPAPTPTPAPSGLSTLQVSFNGHFLLRRR